jgi:hypothetical protein
VNLVTISLPSKCDIANVRQVKKRFEVIQIAFLMPMKVRSTILKSLAIC